MILSATVHPSNMTLMWTAVNDTAESDSAALIAISAEYTSVDKFPYTSAELSLKN